MPVKSNLRLVAAGHRKPSSYAKAPEKRRATNPRTLHPGRSRQADRGSQGQSPRSPRRHHDPRRLPARLAGRRGCRSALGERRPRVGDAPCHAGQERQARHAPDPRRRTPRPAQAPARGAEVAVRVRVGARRPVHHGQLQLAGQAGRPTRWPPVPSHAHMLRHACGYALANAGHDTRSLQDYLGLVEGPVEIPLKRDKRI